MGLKERLSHLVGRLYFDRPAQKLTVAEYAAQLRRSGEELSTRLAAARETPQLRETMRHVIGIERWGQRRLRSFLGEPVVMDGHHSYKPAADAGWDQLRRDFAEMRAETVALAERLATAEPTSRVPHNQFGPFSARGWLRYLRGHADFELRRVK